MKDEITVYKILSNDDSSIHSPMIKWTPGETIGNYKLGFGRKVRKSDYYKEKTLGDGNKQIYLYRQIAGAGIYVFLQKPTKGNNWISLKAKKEDLLAVSIQSQIALFTKVTLTTKSYNQYKIRQQNIFNKNGDLV